MIAPQQHSQSHMQRARTHTHAYTLSKHPHPPTHSNTLTKKQVLIRTHQQVHTQTCNELFYEYIKVQFII